ncbi:NAD(P)-dependent dehydrogenase (short-subunit alcohol dehydrogenase family) [Sphingobium fontiphilum]|uniref:NAD(P)-dependent dehydrogenase (Short-subunit alcohol dehydrogenase family) n=1 Tax=Sphingobium fontiphilum TaxID=944425 RepID=A0A7W6GNF4_9SPHN|nr:SDR family oxidoreductase [Sphingobium fontiphilum]MBB3982261.1 NAD(P)-dependent dehydrogenase (short-subunit alcohol dehydrogenase family) [Sphingobium fontiphilum]
MAEKEFTGKVVLVTGAASGLGRAAALRFAAEGAQVCLADLNAEGLVETARRITAAGGESASCAGDLGDPAHCAEAVATAIEAFGRLDVLCNVAGILRFHALAKVTADDWARLFAANVSAPFFMMQAAMPHLVETKGNVVNVVSTAAFLGQAYTAPYSATKAALLSLTKSLAMEFMHAPVRINALAPGGMMTEMVQTLEFPQDADQSLIARYIGLRPPAQPEDIVEPMLFLASDRARTVHGACYTADSGITAG